MPRGPKGKVVTKITTQPKAIKIKLGLEMIEAESNAITIRAGGAFDISAPVPGT